MDTTTITRYTLGLSCPFNLAAAYILAFPSSSLGALAGLPPEVPAIYTALSSFLVALLGLAYGWLAFQTEIDRPLVALAAGGKSGVFVLALILWITGHAAGPLVIIATGDLILAALWFRWLLQPPQPAGYA